MRDKVSSGRRFEAGGIEADADGTDGRAGQPRHLQILRQALVQIGKRTPWTAAQVAAAGLVTQDDRLGLRAVKQSCRHARERRMVQRTLALDHVPSAIVTGRGEMLYRPGNEVRDHGINRNS